MKIVNILLITSTVIIFSACTSKPSVPSVLERDGVDAISNTTDLQMTFMKKYGDLDRYCGSRPSDVADTSSSGASVGGGAIGDSGSVGEDTSQGAVSLGGRNPAVLIVREMMYRACELSMNLNTNTKQTIEIYSKFMDVMKDIASNQTGTGTATLGQKATAVMSIKDSSTSDTSDNDNKANDTNGNSNNNNSSNDDNNDDSNDNSDY